LRALFKSKIEFGPDPKSRLRLSPAFGLRAIVSLTLCLAAAGCAAERNQATSGREFTDEIGRKIKVADQPRRIVSLAPSITETLFALGLGDRVVAVTTYCNYPPEAAQKPKVGDTQKPSLETVIALKPDLVIISTASQLQQFVRNLDGFGIPVYVSNPRDIQGAIASIEMIGDVTGTSARASELAADMRERINKIQSRLAETTERPKTFFILGVEPLITIGRLSFVNELISRAGGQSISGDVNAEYPQYSLESAVAGRPEVIFFQTSGEKLPARLSETPAARAGRVFHIDDDLLLRPGPRIVEGLEQMAARIHPELFNINDKR
jgi:cobalamin transport system substrate-binding protein